MLKDSIITSKVKNFISSILKDNLNDIKITVEESSKEVDSIILWDDNFLVIDKQDKLNSIILMMSSKMDNEKKSEFIRAC